MKLITYNRTKIVCTIGPASSSREMLEKLIRAGMDVARLNFSHGSHEQHAEVIATLKSLRKELDINLAILQDLQGPKIRVGALDEPFKIKKGDLVKFHSGISERNGNILPIQYKTFATDVKPGDLVLVDDGKVQLNVLETDNEDEAVMEVVHGDEIGSRKGVNLPFTKISLPSITEKDKRDLEFGVEQGVDWIALSFVRSPREVQELREMISAHGGDQRVISKVEKPEALKSIDEIISESDGIMVARGDLGVEVPMETVPMWQKTIIKKCNENAKPVIVATQMMESMIENRRPTRAETNDVANAVIDGADALMLSGETSVGRFPAEVVQSMRAIIASMEEHESIYYKNMRSDHASPTFLNDALIVSACELASTIEADAIVGNTVSGYTAYQLSKCRPSAHIFIFTPNKKLLNILSLVWGVRAFYYDSEVDTDHTISEHKKILKQKGMVRRGDLIINTASMPLHEKGRTNMLKVSMVE